MEKNENDGHKNCGGCLPIWSLAVQRIDMTIDINDREQQALAEMFEAAEKQLIAGIDHSDVRDYRKKLKERLRILEGLHVKITGERLADASH